LKLCFLVSEYFRWGKYGGYGTSTRILATELVRRGHEVDVVTPRRADQPGEEIVDGVRILARLPHDLPGLVGLFRTGGATVFHSHEPSFAGALALWAVPDRAHVVTCRDTRLFGDWIVELRAWLRDGSLRTLLTWPYENNPLVSRAVRRADGVWCASEFSRPLAQRKYGLGRTPGFLPSPLAIPAPRGKRSRPTVCWLGRWDSRKRPHLFFELAERFPDVEFVAMGKGRTETNENDVRARWAGLPNVTLLGLVDQFADPERFWSTLGGSWILVNTALREGLPRSFMEAAGQGCAILSRVDPDGFASRFGHRVIDDDFASGLAKLLEGDRWRALGEAGRRHVAATYGLETAVDRHLDAYADALEAAARRTAASGGGRRTPERQSG
jgi:glycosyltransferase involved in cell wall biosynthesis